MKLVLVLLVAGCLPQKAIPMYTPMPPGTPFGHRYNVFVGQRAMKIDRDDHGFSLQRSRYSDPYLLLANGERVFDPVKLSPYIAPTTELGKGITKEQRGRARNREINLVSIVAIAGSAALITVGALAVADDRKVLGGIPLAIGVVGFFGGMGYWTFSTRAKRELIIDDDMIADYNVSLAASLRLCVTQLEVVDCDNAAPPMQPYPHQPPPPMQPYPPQQPMPQPQPPPIQQPSPYPQQPPTQPPYPPPPPP